MGFLIFHAAPIPKGSWLHPRAVSDILCSPVCPQQALDFRDSPCFSVCLWKMGANVHTGRLSWSRGWGQHVRRGGTTHLSRALQELFSMCVWLGYNVEGLKQEEARWWPRSWHRASTIEPESVKGPVFLFEKLGAGHSSLWGKVHTCAQRVLGLNSSLLTY